MAGSRVALGDAPGPGSSAHRGEVVAVARLSRLVAALVAPGAASEVLGRVAAVDSGGDTYRSSRPARGTAR